MPESRFGSDLIGLALAEDLDAGDVTAGLFPAHTALTEARIVARGSCTFAGGGPAVEVFRRVDPRINIFGRLPDGTQVSAGTSVLGLQGPSDSLVSAERTALNFVQHLSGIATLTRAYVDAVAGTRARILDTRKTTPGLRLLEKAAVRAGGGTNHRLGLGDMVMVKDNHIAASGGIPSLQDGIHRAKARGLRVEIEVDSLAQLDEVLALEGVDVILLDNMPPAILTRAVARRKPGLAFEASGGITLENIRAIAETGVDFISVGALTHSAPIADLGLDFDSTPCRSAGT